MTENPTCVYQSGQKVEISGRYQVTGDHYTDQSESVAASPEYTLHEGDLFPNYDGRATSFTLIEPTLSQDNIPHSTDYSMPWQI